MKSVATPLSVAFGIASAAAFAQSANDPMAQLRTCSLMESAERLSCLDKLSRNIAPPATPSEADNWVVSETTSPVDYKPIVAASAFSRGSDSSMQLSIYCRNGRTELVVTAPALSRKGETYALSYSVNGNPPVQLAAGSPLSGTGAAFQGDVVRLLASFPDEGDLVIRLSTRMAPAFDGSFSLGGLKMVRDKIAAACNWPRAVANPRH
ncbi:MAG: hypothetical protein QOK23_4259 [Gammaproteobacteria bacterium]|jgi:hypothetical protein|nr:hypothetical protein [Gammaproteobacteria bacterium]